MDAYSKALIELFDLQKFGIKLGLNSTENLLSRLGDPHLGLKCAHLAGTNGKGSVGAMMEAALLEAGVKVGFYTSPHLINFTERFRLGGKDISRTRLLKLIKQVWKVSDPAEPPTFFEFVTAMAFLYFAQESADWALVETGLGGRLDATNICRPQVSVITNIGLEHQEYLGDTLSDIAFEKAGIIKPGIPVVHGVQQAPARRVVEDRAAESKSQVIRRGRDISFRRNRDDGFNLKGTRWILKDAATNLTGRHQASNACLALGALEVLAQAGAPVNEGHLRTGLARVNWPGRLERFEAKGAGPAVWLDGAHNLPAARTMVESLDQVRAESKPLVMVLGMMADKALSEILEILAPAADYVIYSRPKYMRAAPAAKLAAAAPADAAPCEVDDDLARAIKKAKKRAGKDGVVLVTGSLFTVGEARAILQGQVITGLPQ